MELHQVSDEELCRIEEDCGRPSRDLGSVTLALPLFVALLVPLLTNTHQLSPLIRTTFIIIVSVSGFVSIVKGLKWFRTRKKGPATIARIRKRKTNQPDPSEE